MGIGTRALLLAVLLTPSLPATRPWAATITIDNFTFTPAQVEVPAGEVVTWLNRDDMPHVVAAQGEPRALKSPPLDTDDHYAFTFATPGTYRYFCSLHPTMQGVVVVK